MKPPTNIFLVGPMGAGKSTTGRQLARALEKSFIDSDKEIEESTGADIPLIFDLEGEEGFRQRESAMLDKLTLRQNVVLATGGGAVLMKTNRSMLMSRGFVIYLHAPIEYLVERTARDRNRPLLQTDDPHGRFTELMETREPLYNQVADLVVSTDGRSARYVVKEILRTIDDL